MAKEKSKTVKKYHQTLERIPTPCELLNITLCGGFLFGKYIELWG